jgi:hypothetical protein
MSGLNTAALQIQGAAAAAAITNISLHSATPDASGSNATGSRKAVTASSTSGVITIPSTAFTGLPANGPVAAVGFWSASTGGTFLGYEPLTGDSTANAAGEYTVDSVTITGSAS